MSAHRAFIGVGSNVGDRLQNVERAFEAIAGLGNVVATSSIYRTKPWGNTQQPWFANAVALVETQHSPRDVLTALKGAETLLGRRRVERWGPRSIDLDLLFYDDLAIDEPGLRVPHARLAERAFVLVPLAEIDARFTAMRDALPTSELAGVVFWQRARSVDDLRENN